jgi:hypothetical protein
MAENTEKWGKATARSRYGAGEGTAGMRPSGEPQKNQCPEDQHGPKYNNDTPDNWLRGNGMKPGFDRHKAGR